MPELTRLFSEGRAEYRGRQARSGLDVLRSLATLGVDRGIDRFVRYGFVERNGLATFAVPMGRVKVAPVAGASVLGDIDGWLGRLRRARNLPATTAASLRAIDEAQIAFSRYAGDGERSRHQRATAAQRLLSELAVLHGLAESSRSVAEAVREPIAGLRASEWLPLIDDDSVEHDLAAALASMRRADGSSVLRPLLRSGRMGGTPPPVIGLSRRPVVDVLADCLVRLSRDVTPPRSSQWSDGWLGPVWSRTVGLAAVDRLVSCAVDDDRLTRLLDAYLLLNWKGSDPTKSDWRLSRSGSHPLLAVVKPFFHVHLVEPPAADGTFRPGPTWARLLESGRSEFVAADAVRRLRINGLAPRVCSPAAIAAGVNPVRVAAACLVPVTDRSIDRLVRQSSVVPNSHSLFRRPVPDQPAKEDNA